MRPTMRRVLDDRRGGALLIVLLMTFAVGAMVAGAVALGGNNTLMHAAARTQADLEAAAMGGVALGNAMINEDGTLVPNTGSRQLENAVPVVDATGGQIAGLRRSTWVARVGSDADPFWRVVAEARNSRGDRAIRTSVITQQSFAQFAYFTNREGGNIWFGGGDIVRGPVHSNDRIQIHATGATFVGPVTTAASSIHQPQFATFEQGYRLNQPEIPMPTLRDIESLQDRAAEGGTAFAAPVVGLAVEAALRLEFVTVDLNAAVPGAPPEWHGYVRAFRLKQPLDVNHRNWVTARRPQMANGFRNVQNQNCGYFQDGSFVAAGDVPNVAALADVVCHLGGDPRLQPDGRFHPEPDRRNAGVVQQPGEWVRWNGAVPQRLREAMEARGEGALAAEYLIPLTDRSANPGFKGVVYVNGRVAVSGQLRGRVTLAATDNIVIVDDLTYHRAPGAAAVCSSDGNDMLGLFSGKDIVVADNMINAPQRPTPLSNTWTNFEARNEPNGFDETIHAVVLALGSFLAESFDSGSTGATPCGASSSGRGCLRLSGGIIQEVRGAVGTTTGTGYVKRYAWDPCAAVVPPPSFPVTGLYRRTGLFEHDPTGLDIQTLLQ